MQKSLRQPEVEMVSRLAQTLERDGWDVYHSVRHPGAPTLELDLCGVRHVRGELQTIAIEAKERISLALWSKAIMWRAESTFAAIASGLAGWRRDEMVASTLIHHRTGIGAYCIDAKGVHVIWEPQHTGALKEDVQVMADAARKSSRGLVQPGGARSPIRVKNVHLLVETAIGLYPSDANGAMFLSSLLPGETPADCKAVAKILNSNRSLGYWAKKSGKDFLIYSRGRA